MVFRIFLSHSTRDQGIVVTLANLMTKLGIEVLVAEWYLTPGSSLDEKVFQQIDESDSVVVLLTQNGVRSNWVNQELGYALKAGKPVIPLVEKGIAERQLGSLQGKEYIEYDPDQPQQSLTKASAFMNSLKLDKENREKGLLVIGGIVLLLLLLSGTGGAR
ncbi:MAG: toll/interleukin-1 receptor domain-containing protein [Promethearchaeati archaeon SRVP18_Atabeyarchaeia-1]